MIIGIDAQSAAIKKRTGVENMTREIIHALLEIDHNNSYFLYSNLPLTLKKEYKNVQIVQRKRRFWHKTVLPDMIEATKPDVFLELSNSLPKKSPEKSIIFVLDLASKIFPNAYSFKQRFLLNNAFASALKAQKIIFISNATKRDFNDFYPGFSKNNQHVIYPGVAEKAPCKEITQRPKGHKDYILFVGRIEEKKNVKNLIKGYAIAKEKFELKQDLVLVGKPGYGYRGIIREILKQPKDVASTIFELGYVSDSELACLYKHADLFVYPSVYEGFGMPILEAFSHNLPVACSKISSIPEAAGDAAIYFNPESINEIAEAISKPLLDKNLQTDMIKKGQEQLKKFSYAKTARELLDIINKLNN